MSNSKSTLDTKLIKQLADILVDGNLGEIEVEHDGLRVRVSKPAAPVAVQAPVHVAAPAATPASPIAAAAPSAAATAAPSNAITSPMVGTAYLAAEPGAKPFVAVGDKVKKGDTLLLVEAMKTFNPVTAPSAGTVKDIIITDGQPVEFGEPLIVVE